MQHHDYLTYEDFGRRFFEVAVTPERVAASFAEIAGSEFDMEPIAQGPGGIAKVSAHVKINEPRVTRKLGDLITFVIHIPLSIDLLLDLRLDKQRFKVAGDIALRATARAAEPLLLIVDVAKPRPSDITVNVSSKSIRGRCCAFWPVLTARSGGSSPSTSLRRSIHRSRRPPRSSM
ncbi:hypothetical protein I546_3851 [Mycobacterium kansasii 732]|nr:hypothetical protein I546_3851 [Mycobacterium kansasii 732]